MSTKDRTEERTEERVVGIVHRVKKLASGEARPTLVAVKTAGKEEVDTFALATEDDEFLFLRGRFPVAFRDVKPDEDLTGVHPGHVKWKKVKRGVLSVEDDLPHQSQRRQDDDGKWSFAAKVAVAFIGIQAGDTVVSILGGSGDRFNAAIARQLQELGSGRVMRITPARFNEFRGEESKDNDHLLVIEAFEEFPEYFQVITLRDIGVIKARYYYRLREDALKSLLACEQRLSQRLIGRVFFSEGGQYPEGLIEDQFVEVKANDLSLQALIKAERTAYNELKKAVAGLDIYHEIFASVTGVGPRIAAPLIATIGDIRRFPTVEQFRSYAGVAPDSKGKFRRRRAGQVANWSGDCRQAVWLFVSDQLCKRKESEWGQVFLAEKARLRRAHPEIIIDERNKRRYTDGHIHKMAVWHTANKFVTWLYGEWNRLVDPDWVNPSLIKLRERAAAKQRGEVA